MTGEPWVLTVAAVGDGTAIGGGRAAPCNPDPPLVPEERTSTARPCGDFVPGCGDGSLCDEQKQPPWCHTNACGSITTNGRFAISECEGDLTQMPPCTGPGAIRYTQCDGDDVTASFTFISECSSGGRTWTGTFADGEVSLEYVCGDTFGPENVTLSIDGCSLTVTEASITCDGPLGYAVFNFSFTGTCGECEITGCGVFGDEDCELTVDSPCCDNPLPQTLTATLSSTGCADANGQVVDLEWNGTVWTWSGSFGGNSWSISLGCNGTSGDSCASKWAIGGVSGCQPSQAFGQSGCSCDPLSVTFVTTIAGSGCGGGCSGDDLTVVITAA